MKKIAALIIIASFGLAGCNEEKPQTQEQQAKDTNEAIGKSTAVPTLDMPEKGKYKY